MKKFWTVSIILILVSAIAFSGSLFYYIDTTKEDVSTVDQLAPTKGDKDDNEEPTQAVSTNVPEEFLDGGIFSENYEKAYTYMQAMSDEQMVGQLLIASCPTDDTAKDLVTKYSLSGYYFTADNFYALDAQGIRDEIDAYQNAANTPMIMSVKEEGGAVTAISDLSSFTEYDFSSPRDTFAQGGMDAIKENETKKATMLRSVGINLNLAPVLDMAEELNQIMYSRSLGGTVEETTQYAKDVTTISQQKGVSVALKHFPGYGTNLDSYEPIVVDEREKSVFESTDFKPFEAGIEAGAHCVLVSNMLAQNLDSRFVASLSKDVHSILRDEMKFTGLIMTDNLNNADYSGYSGGEDVYVQAVLAGNDLIMIDEVEAAYTAILDAVNDGTIDKTTLQKACLRVLAYKYTAGILK